MPRQHLSIQRLYAAASEQGDSTPANVARRMNVSAQTLNNWETRGISEKGALLAQECYGVDANWLLSDSTTEPRRMAPRSESRSVRLDPEMMAELATVLGERMKTVGGFDLRNEDHAAHFVQCYELFINMKEQPTPENVVEFSSALISPRGATGNEQGKDVPVEGTTGQGVRKGARRRAGT